MSKDTNFFYQLLPWNFITKFHPGVVIQKNGNMQRTLAYRAPDVDSSGAFEINSLAVRVNEFSKRLGAGWALHIEAQRFQLQEYPSSEFDVLAPHLIDRERDRFFNSAGSHFESSYYITFTKKQPSESVKKLTALFIQNGGDGDENLSIKQNVGIFVNESDAAAALLSNEVSLVPLDNEQTVAYLHSSISFNRHCIKFDHTRILLDRILPDSALENSFPMKLGDYYIPIIGINDFPDESYPAILDSLNRALVEYRWVTRYICLDKEEGAREARKKEKAHRGSRKTFFQTFAESTSGEPVHAVNHGASVKEEDSIDAGVEIDTDKAALGYLTTCVIVWDKNLALAKKKAEYVRNIINSKGFTCKDESLNALESFQAAMPGQVYASYRALPVMSNTMAHVVPLSSVWAGIQSNDHTYKITGADTPHLICSTVEGTPFFLSLNVGDVGHSAVWGPTGSGKSTFLNLLSLQFFKYPGSQVITFDKGRSCRLPCLASGGLFYEPAAENTAGINFQPLRDLDTDNDVINAIDFIEACVTASNATVTPLMRSAIKNCVEHLREIEVERRTISSFLQYIHYSDPDTGKPVFNDLLGDYTIGGKYGRIFDSDASHISLNARFIAFEMEALMNRGLNCVVPALVYLFNLIDKKFDGRLTMLILDEAWLFLKNEIFSAKIAEWLKVLRKKNVYVVFATQDLADVKNSPLKTTIMQQCLTKIYLADTSALTPGMMEFYTEFGLTDSEIDLIASAQMKKDYFYTSPLGRRLFQLDLGPLTLALIGSPDHKMLDDLAAKYEPGSALCEKILKAKRINYKSYAGADPPVDPEPQPRLENSLIQFHVGRSLPQTQDMFISSNTLDDVITSPAAIYNNAEFLDAVSSLPERKKSDGKGRAADRIAEEFGVSSSTVYQARIVLKYGSPETVDSLRRGDVSFKTAYKIVKKERKQDRIGLN